MRTVWQVLAPWLRWDGPVDIWTNSWEMEMFNYKGETHWIFQAVCEHGIEGDYRRLSEKPQRR